MKRVVSDGFLEGAEKEIIYTYNFEQAINHYERLKARRTDDPKMQICMLLQAWKERHI